MQVGEKSKNRWVPNNDGGLIEPSQTPDRQWSCGTGQPDIAKQRRDVKKLLAAGPLVGHIGNRGAGPSTRKARDRIGSSWNRPRIGGKVRAAYEARARTAQVLRILSREDRAGGIDSLAGCEAKTLLFNRIYPAGRRDARHGVVCRGPVASLVLTRIRWICLADGDHEVRSRVETAGERRFASRLRGSGFLDAAALP